MVKTYEIEKMLSNVLKIGVTGVRAATDGQADSYWWHQDLQGQDTFHAPVSRKTSCGGGGSSGE